MEDSDSLCVIDITSDTEKSESNNADDIVCNDSLPCTQFDMDYDEDRPCIDDLNLTPIAEFQSVLCDSKNTIVDEESSDDTLPYVPSPVQFQPVSDVEDSQVSPTKKKPTTKEKKEAMERKKQERQQEKAEKKLEIMKEKALKAVTAEQQKMLKPEESLKLMKVHISNELVNSAYGGNLVSCLQQADIRYAVEADVEPHTLHWTKRAVLSNAGTEQDQGWLLTVLSWQEMVQLIQSRELRNHVQLRTAGATKVLLVIFGMEKYFAYQKLKQNRTTKDKIQGTQSKPKPAEREFDASPIITRMDVDMQLTELELWENCSHRLIETADDVATLVVQLTKSMAQIEFKQEKWRKEQDTLEWYARADSKDCVKVDRNGNGLARLWQQQICQFPAVGIETAQAITSQYNSPTALWHAYNSCADANQAELLLQNIPIRRNAGILSTSRKIGPELSRKLYRFFTSLDHSEEL